MSDPNTELNEIDKEKEKRIRDFMYTLIPILGLINSTSSYTSAMSQVSNEIDRFMLNYRVSMGDTIFDTMTAMNPQLALSSKSKIIEGVFAQTFKVTGTNNYITFNELLFRRAEKLKDDISQLFIYKNGFETPSMNTLNEIISDTLAKNKKSLARIVSNETHKAVLQSDIDMKKQEGVPANKKVFIYQTAGDDRVRPSHSSHQGEELTLAQAEVLQSGVMSQINCRCYFDNIM